MATFELNDIDANALRQLAADEGRSIDELATEAVRDLVSRRAGSTPARDDDVLAQEIVRVRGDQDFMTTLGSLVERDREILDRLAE